MQQRTPQDVQAALDELGLQIEVQFYLTDTATAQQASDTIGCDLGAIVKRLCFIINGEPYDVLCAGDRLVDDHPLGAHLGVCRKKCKIADRDTAIRVTGYAPGGIPPVGYLSRLTVIIDASLARFKVTWAAAGAPNAVFPIAFGELVRVTEGSLVELGKPLPQ